MKKIFIAAALTAQALSAEPLYKFQTPNGVMTIVDCAKIPERKDVHLQIDPTKCPRRPGATPATESVHSFRKTTNGKGSEREQATAYFNLANQVINACNASRENKMEPINVSVAAGALVEALKPLPR
jgi:hypothetical protein